MGWTKGVDSMLISHQSSTHRPCQPTGQLPYANKPAALPSPHPARTHLVVAARFAHEGGQAAVGVIPQPLHAAGQGRREGGQVQGLPMLIKAPYVVVRAHGLPELSRLARQSTCALSAGGGGGSRPPTPTINRRIHRPKQRL